VLENEIIFENTSVPFTLDILREALLTKQDGHTGKVQDNKGKKRQACTRLFSLYIDVLTCKKKKEKPLVYVYIYIYMHERRFKLARVLL
jgi:hypothetical protein